MNVAFVRPSTLSDEILFIEPFYGGSHKQLIDLLIRNLNPRTRFRLITLKAKKWPWRARCSALIVSSLIPTVVTAGVLFATSVLNLTDLIGLRPDLAKLKKVVYFHENQMVYPVRTIKERDIQFAYNQITTCLTADVIIFNSNYNMNSFLSNIKNIIKIIPDYRPRNLRALIEPKSLVLYFPIDYFSVQISAARQCDRVLHIVWPHRWEFDKNPNTFVDTLLNLKTLGFSFRVSIIGETFTDVPNVMAEVKERLAEEIVHFGFVESKDEYYKILQSSHVAVSTALHEFFGVSMLEATYCGCFPLVPDRLVYPEIYPKDCLYDDDIKLYERLKEYCINPNLAIEQRKGLNMDFTPFSARKLLPEYYEILCKDVAKYIL